MLVAVDPGSSGAGLALFGGDGDALIACKQVKVTGGDPIRRSIQIARFAEYWIVEQGVIPDLVVVEWPEIYRGHPRPKDLLIVAGAAVAIAYALSNLCAAVATVLPREWTKGSKKSTRGNAWKSPRGARIARCLTPAEIKIVGEAPKHDELDAVGIGLYATGRFEAGRFPDAR